MRHHLKNVIPFVALFLCFFLYSVLYKNVKTIYVELPINNNTAEMSKRNISDKVVSQKLINNNNIIWPKHWKLILEESERLQLILLDSEALKCISGKQQRKRCQSLYSQNVMRFGTIINNMDYLAELIHKYVIPKSNGTLKFSSLLPQNKIETIILKYNASENYLKYILITSMEFSAKNKNYHLLHGGDVASTIAVRPFNTSLFETNFGANILVPRNIQQYLFFFENGRFFECNQTLANEISKNASKNQTAKIPPGAAETLSEFMDEIMETGQIPFMAFGTLLGWYRDCGFIPHTSDIDFYIMADQYVDGFEKAYINHTKFPASRKIGKKEYGLEMSFWNIYKSGSVHMDIFYLYENNATTQWSPLLTGFDDFQRAKFIIPKVDGLCTGDLYGYLFFIPCNFMEVIKANNGFNWHKSLPDVGYYEDGAQTILDGFWKIADKNDVLNYF